MKRARSAALPVCVAWQAVIGGIPFLVIFSFSFEHASLADVSVASYLAWGYSIVFGFSTYFGKAIEYWFPLTSMLAPSSAL